MGVGITEGEATGLWLRNYGTVVGCVDLIAAPLRSEDGKWSVTAVDGGAQRTMTTVWFSDEWSLVLPATMADWG
ncbi:hypothetical protein U1Q18_026087 [Sarracenia purpurea var. burkii]